MAKEQEDVIDQLVNGQGVEKAQSATEQGVEDQVAAGVEKPAEEQVQDEQKIPLSRFNEVNERMKVAEEQAQQARDQLALTQANQGQVEQQQPVSNYEQALRDCGLFGEDFLNQEQQIQLNTRMEQLGMMRVQQQQQAIADQQFAQRHSDFGKVVGQLNQVTGQFMATAELQKLLMEKPFLRASCTTAQGAYEIIMQERKLADLSQKAAVMQQQQTQQQIDANLAPMSSTAAGGGAVDRTKGQITQDSTTEDVRALEQQVKSGKFG